MFSWLHPQTAAAAQDNNNHFISLETQSQISKWHFINMWHHSRSSRLWAETATQGKLQSHDSFHFISERFQCCIKTPPPPPTLIGQFQVNTGTSQHKSLSMILKDTNEPLTGSDLTPGCLVSGSAGTSASPCGAAAVPPEHQISPPAASVGSNKNRGGGGVHNCW